MTARPQDGERGAVMLDDIKRAIEEVRLAHPPSETPVELSVTHALWDRLRRHAGAEHTAIPALGSIDVSIVTGIADHECVVTYADGHTETIDLRPSWVRQAWERIRARVTP